MLHSIRPRPLKIRTALILANQTNQSKIQPDHALYNISYNPTKLANKLDSGWPSLASPSTFVVNVCNSSEVLKMCNIGICYLAAGATLAMVS